jgi:hypothetical protein
MKYFALLLAAAGVTNAADFSTGQAARLVIGQETFTREASGASESLLGGLSGIAYANNTLFVVDSNRVGASPQNNRVLIFPNLSGSLPEPTAELPKDAEKRCPVCTGTAAAVVGQASFTTTDIGLSQSTLRQPSAVASDGRILAVTDTDNNRVLIWNTIPTGSGAPADVVVGQPDFKTATSNLGGGNTPNNKGLRGPQGVWLQDGKLYVADTQNHRVLIWNHVPTSNGQPADVVLGQPNFNTFVEPDISQTPINAKIRNIQANPIGGHRNGIQQAIRQGE